MKATGIVRRIDDLGRVVVPKEIRRTFRIREGDPLEIFTGHDGEIILKKYSPIGELGTFAKQYSEAIAQATGHIVLIADKDLYIAAAGGRKEWLNKPISRELERTINERGTVSANRDDHAYVKLAPDEEATWQIIVTIICEGDAIGAVIILGKSANPNGITAESALETELKVAQAAAIFLGKQMEN